jgi:hypothetical protein
MISRYRANRATPRGGVEAVALDRDPANRQAELRRESTGNQGGRLRKMPEGK